MDPVANDTEGTKRDSDIGWRRVNLSSNAFPPQASGVEEKDDVSLFEEATCVAANEVTVELSCNGDDQIAIRTFPLAH